MRIQPRLTMGRGLALLWSASPATAEQVTVEVVRGLIKDEPYTIIYPASLKAGSGSGDDLLVLDYPGAPLQCAATMKVGVPAMSAQEALAAFDAEAEAAPWRERFPNFTVADPHLGSLANVPALRYLGDTGQSPGGNRYLLYRAEAVDEGRLYGMECMVGYSIAQDARDIIEFLIINFSTRSDGKCCQQPGGQ